MFAMSMGEIIQDQIITATVNFTYNIIAEKLHHQHPTIMKSKKNPSNYKACNNKKDGDWKLLLLIRSLEYVMEYQLKFSNI